jgi:hypothetical protein
MQFDSFTYLVGKQEGVALELVGLGVMCHHHLRGLIQGSLEKGRKTSLNV